MKLIYCLMAAMTLSIAAKAQDDDDNDNKGGKSDKSHSIALTTDGLRVDQSSKAKSEKTMSISVGGVDLGINALQDNSVYTSLAAKNFLVMPAKYQNSNLFDLRTGKSVNVNIWPVLGRGRILKTKRQKIYLSTGVGMQIYNFRFTNGVDYALNIPTATTLMPGITLDSVTNYKKNKLTLVYLSIPLNLTFKTKMANKLWLVYGVGITGGFRVSSYNKQVSALYGKVREKGNFYLNDFNSTVTAEFGLDNYFRLYASYQLTNMYKDVSGLDQHPFAIGLRFGGI